MSVQILDCIASAPGNGTVFRAYSPVPCPVPLPPCHTLATRHPDLQVPAAFGDLKNITLHIDLVCHKATEQRITIR